MYIYDIIQIAFYLIVLIVLIPVLGKYMARVFLDENHILKSAGKPVEKIIYRLISCKGEEMDWKKYAYSLLVFNFMGFLFLFFLQLCQSYLPLNPQKLPAPSWSLAFNTSISFVTNTNWQSYAGETTLSYLVQMAGLTVQNFLSAATGIAVLLAVIRGLVRENYQHDRQFLDGCNKIHTLCLITTFNILCSYSYGSGSCSDIPSICQSKHLMGSEQIIPLGPVSSQIAIKQLGTNGGGFFNANSSHPFENPTPFSNFLEMLAILLIPSALTFTYGRLIGSRQRGLDYISCNVYTAYNWSGSLLLLGIQIFTIHGLSINMEGKETRFGLGNSVLWSVITTSASNGSINAMMDSLTPLSGMVAIFNIMLGEVIFGGVGSGIYGIIMFIILTVFIAGLMVGRSPEFLGKKIEAFEVKMAMIAILAPNFVILTFSAIGCITTAGLSSLNNPGPHGLSEILYAFSSAAGNNGSAFAGLNTNTVFYNLLSGLGMLIGRFGIIISVLAIAGNMAGKKITPLSDGTFRTDTWLFGLLLIAVILIVGGLTFFPALSLGPIVEHLLLLK